MTVGGNFLEGIGLPRRAAAVVDGYRVAVIGTSLAQHNNVATISASSPKQGTAARGWLYWVQVLSNGRFRCDNWYDDTVYDGWEPSGVPDTTRGWMGLNAGVSGQTIERILARKEFLVENIDCDMIIVDAGTNDMGPVAKEKIQSDREELCDYYAGQGKLVVLLPILARATSSWASGSDERKKANWINQRSRQFAGSRRNIILFDWNDPWVDKGDVDGQPKTGYSVDGIHFTPVGAYFVGKALNTFLEALLPKPHQRVVTPDDQFDLTENPLGNLFTNPFCAGTAGVNGTGSSGSVADGFRLERSSGASTVVASKEAGADGASKQVATFTLSGSGSDLFYLRTATANTAHSLAAQWIQASIDVEVSDADALTELNVFIDDQATNGGRVESLEEQAGENWAFGESWAGRIITPPLLLRASSTDFRLRVQMAFDASVAGTPVIKVTGFECRQIDDPRTALNFTAP